MALYLNDKTSNANNLTNVNTVTEVTSSLPFSQSTSAAQFTAASSQYLTAADAASLDLSGNFTIEMWVKFDSLPSASNAMALVMKGNYVTDGAYQLQLNNSSGTYKLRVVISQTANASTQDVVEVTVTPSTGTWYHYAVVCTIANSTATKFEFFVNGVSVGNGTALVSGNSSSINNSSDLLRIGVGNVSGSLGSYLDGKLDDIRIWSVARTSTQIGNNYNIELTGSESGLVAYYPFEAVLGGTGAAFLLNLV